MSSFTQSLLNRLEKASGQAPPWGDVNPLVVIGLTEAILDLGLTEDQMYAVVRSFLRQLAAQVHPDREQTGVSSERQRHIIDSLNYLDDRENFTRALTDFRNLKAEDRRETKLLSQTLGALRGQITGFEKQFEGLLIGQQQLAADRSSFEQQKKEEPLKVPDLEVQIGNLRAAGERHEQSLREAQEKSLNRKRQLESAVEYLAYLGAPVGKYGSGVDAFHAQWVAVASLWPDHEINPSPFGEGGKVRAAFLRDALAIIGERETLNGTLRSWKLAEALLGKPDKLDIKYMPLGLSIIKLESGWSSEVVGYRAVGFGGRVIGSIPSDKIPVERPRLRYQIANEVVLETVHPFIVPGGLLVSIARDIGSRKWEQSLTCPAFRFATKRLVLAVG